MWPINRAATVAYLAHAAVRRMSRRGALGGGANTSVVLGAQVTPSGPFVVTNPMLRVRPKKGPELPNFLGRRSRRPRFLLR